MRDCKQFVEIPTASPHVSFCATEPGARRGSLQAGRAGPLWRCPRLAGRQQSKIKAEQRASERGLGPSSSSRDALDDAVASTTSSPTVSGSSAEAGLGDMFIRHRVANTDNLAGLAVRYNVTVADIKHANGLLSDTAMFAKDTLLIPTKPMPLSPEYSAWAGMIVAHYERAAALPPSRQRTSSSAALNELRGYYSTGASPGYSDEEEGGGFLAGRRRQPQGEVELMTRQQGFAPGAAADDRLRRRNYSGDYDENLESGSALASTTTGAFQALGMPAFRAPSLFRSGPDGRPGMLGGLPDLRDLQRRSSKWTDQMLTKIKRVASQPALAAPPSAGVGHAAEAAILSTRASAPVGATPAHQMQQLVYSATSSRQKEARKAD